MKFTRALVTTAAVSASMLGFFAVSSLPALAEQSCCKINTNPGISPVIQKYQSFDGDSFTASMACFAAIGCDPSVENAVKNCSARCDCQQTAEACKNAEELNKPKTDEKMPTTAAPIKQITNPLGTADIRDIVARFIRIITGISGSLALLMFVYGGFLWTTSGGNSEQVKKGQKVFVNASIGLIIIFTAYVGISALFKVFAGASL